MGNWTPDRDGNRSRYDPNYQPPNGYNVYGEPAVSQGFMVFVTIIGIAAFILCVSIIYPAVHASIQHENHMAVYSRELGTKCDGDAVYTKDCESAQAKAFDAADAAYPEDH